MSDFRTVLAEMRRPCLLMRAVRFGLADYRRTRMLQRLVPGETVAERIVPRLIAAEAALEEIRLRGDAGYSISDHIEVLVTLIAEARLLSAPRSA
ncbi:DUF6477 family protein [Xinfangfangia pollutisoli]|uniref:DUF6477 family protein n=1 Tax=Xinfangfangia pollutisoli TaxID=2865960 RepID=UPI001CD5E339|nr:DUF6477 family protein [Xinfangfangia pollutisoli]